MTIHKMIGERSTAVPPTLSGGTMRRTGRSAGSVIASKKRVIGTNVEPGDIGNVGEHDPHNEHEQEEVEDVDDIDQEPLLPWIKPAVLGGLSESQDRNSPFS